ncbi:hypothetical protein Y032_0025g1287 [Ancylostoma ceylanicum]|uniref:Uncharacterized protein n=1 Tax=Ancylostoma ceylanicum TaxID=53326 RepID=A0A016UWX8_9BILA|nr:hypothetical protein Y032_0025g1287 [Ancylostoma ceylanicum]
MSFDLNKFNLDGLMEIGGSPQRAAVLQQAQSTIHETSVTTAPLGVEAAPLRLLKGAPAEILVSELKCGW